MTELEHKERLKKRLDNERNNLDYDGRTFAEYQVLAAQLSDTLFEVNGYVFKRDTGTRIATKRFNDVYPTLPCCNRILREDWVAMVLRKVPVAESSVLNEFRVRMAYLQQQVTDAMSELDAYLIKVNLAKKPMRKKRVTKPEKDI